MAEIEKNQANINNCSCAACPSYNDCSRGKTEKLFCAKEIGKSSCEYKMNGCVCGNCPVHKENDLQAGYYCLHGSADEVDGK